MKKTTETPLDRYNSHFAATLRQFMDAHPETGEKTTQKALSEYLGVRPQTVSLYCTGESLPNCEQLLRIAEYFDVTADFLMTGKRTENAPVRDMLGLSENTVQNLKLVKDGYFEDTPGMLAILDCLLGNKDFYLAIEKAASWLEEKDGSTSDGFKEYTEWKAAKAIEDFMLDFFKNDLAAIYAQNRE